MKTKKKDEEKTTKSKLSLQKKKPVGKKNLQNILSLAQSSLNETCEFQITSGKSKEPSSAHCLMKIDESDAKTDVQIEEPGDSQKKCPTCESNMPREIFQHHVISCLKDRFENKGSNEGELNQEKFVCQFCMKDLSHYNSTRKTQHLNRCMDKVDEMKQEEAQKKEQLEKARTIVLDCPMCGKSLKTESGRKVHMKKCSQNLGVTTDQLLTLIKQQEEERQIHIAAGVVPKAARSGISKANKPSKKQKQLKEPQSKYEEEMQTALAMSNSLSHSKESSKSETQQQKQGKKKKVESVPPLLMMLSEEEKQKRRSERVAVMLLPRELDDDEIEMENLTPAESRSLIQEKYSAANDKLPSLWTRCELATEKLTSIENKDKFYVETLMPPVSVSHFVVGSNIKKVENIPGRRQSVCKRATEKPQSGNSSIHGDTMLASTQTAVILAELEVNAGTTTDLDLTCSGFCPDSPVKVKDHTRQKVFDAHQKSMVSMVNNPAFSDIKIKTSDETVQAHRLILCVRCPKIIQSCQNELDLTDFSMATVLAVMKFLYAGVLCLPKGSLAEIKELALRFEIDELVEVCSLIMNESKMEEIPQQLEDEEEEKERNFEDLQHLLTEKNTDEDLKDNEEWRNNSSQEEITNEDYNDIMCTQRKKYSVTEGKLNPEDSGKENSEVDQSGVESDVSEREISCFFHDDSFDGTTAEPCKEEDDDSFDGTTAEPCKEEDASQLKCANKRSKGQGNEGVIEEDVEIIDQSKFSTVKGCEVQVEDKRLVKSDDEEMEENMDIEKEGKDGENNKPATEEDHPDVEKLGNSILFEDEDLIIYSDTEDTPTSLESKLNRHSESLHSRSPNPDRSRQANSPLIVDSESNSNSSLETAEVLTEGGDEGAGSPIPQALDSSGLDLFESPVPSECENSQNGPSVSNLKRNQNSKEASPDITSHSQAPIDVETPVKGSMSSRHSMNTRRSNLKFRYQTSPTKQGSENKTSNTETPLTEPLSENKTSNMEEENCVNDEEEIVSPKSVTSIHSKSDEEDEVCLIEEDDQPLISKQTAVSPVFHQLPKTRKKAFKFTRTKPVSSSLQKNQTPEKKKSLVFSIVNSPEISPNEEQKCEVENEQETGLDEPIQDVWEDFDDCGMGGCVVTCDLPSPEQSAQDLIGESPTLKKTNSSLIDTVMETSAVSHQRVSKELSVDGPDDMEHEESFGNDSFDVEMAAQVTENMDSFKTPTTHRLPRKCKKSWVPPSPFTPMPHYDKMDTPQLKKEVQKIGVKPVGKKRMLLLLKDVYQQTHQYETDSEFETSFDEINTEQKGTSEPILVSGDEEDEISSSQESEKSLVLEESIVEDEEEITPSQAGSDVSDLTQKISQFISDMPDIHTRILLYEPIELDALKREITEAGIKCSMDKLMNYLDEKCITFTMKNRRKASPRKGRGRGRKKKSDTETA